MKIGYEVEGRMQGVKTIFCNVKELNTIEPYLRDVQIQQIYISDHDNELNLSHNQHLADLAKMYVITVERTSITQDVDQVINIMLVIEHESFWKLRPNDQIKFTENLHVFSATKRNMTYTPPEDFNGDIEL